MGLKNVRFLVYMIIFLVCTASWDHLICANARSSKQKKPAKKSPQPPPPASSPSNSSIATFNVLNYGAQGNGIADDTNAFAAAWTDACKVQGSVMLVPSGSVFFVKPISFSGPNCQSNIVFQLDGKIIAPTDSGAWGSGLLKFDSCTGVQVSGISISSPADSPNTDGIHLQNSQNVVIHAVSLACGDDCISIQTGCSNVNIYDITCGPGHGISIGGLGPDGTKACVSNINVRDSTIHNTSTGLRIKTWQGGSGSVKGVTFTNIEVSGVGTPLMIDQFYCNSNKCANKTSAVAISDISYQSIKGTYTSRPAYFACSDSTPCVGIKLSNVDLTPSLRRNDPFCWEAFATPAINCFTRTSSEAPNASASSCST